MSRVVLPGHFMGRNSQWTDNQSMANVRLRMGEVQAIYWPTDDNNNSKKFVEYDVWVQHRANGTAVTKMYTNVIGVDALGSVADFSFSTYRVDPSASNQTNKTFKPGFGAKVLLLCINGETNNAVILGGLRDFHADADDIEDGHHLHSRFNGIDMLVNNDGELVITYQGAQNIDGTMADGVDQDAVGTTITISKNGNITLADVDNKNQIVIDHENDQITIESDNEVDVNADTVKVNAQSEFDVTAPTVDIEAEEQVTISSPQVAIGEGELEPPIKGVTFNTALTAFMAAFSVYLTGIAPTADITGTLTPAMLTAIQAFLTAAQAANAVATTVA